MAETFTFEDAKKADSDTFSFEEATGKDESGNTVANLSKSVAQSANESVGGFLKWMGAMETVRPVPEPKNRFLGISVDTLTTEEKDKQRSEATAEWYRNVRRDPLYQAGQFVSQTGRQMDTGRPTFLKKVAGMAGGFLPVVASGPFAAFEIGGQSYGETLDDEYDKAIKSGKTDEEAANIAVGRAQASGWTQAAIWTALPRPLKSVVGKITGKSGVNGLTQFLARRAAGAAEGATLGAASTAGQNLATGQPMSKDVGASALGLGAVQALMPQPGPYRRPVEVVPPERPVAGLLGRGTQYRGTPSGAVIDVTQVSPNEEAELNREAEAESRATASGQERVYNTVDAALRAKAEPIKQTITANGNKWYKRGDFWVTDDPLVTMDKRVIKAGRGNQVEDAVVQDLETKARAGEWNKLAPDQKTQTQQAIEDVTGVSAEQAKKGSAGRTALATREIIENKLWQRFASPQSEYGDKGQMTMRQQDKIKALKDYLAKENDVGVIERHWQQVVRAMDPKYPYDMEYKRLIAERLGHELPEPVEGGDSNATKEIGDQGGTPPKHPGDVEGGPPVQPSGGGGSGKPAPGAAGAKVHPQVERLQKGLDAFEGENLNTMQRQNALFQMQMWVGMMDKAGVHVPTELRQRLEAHIDKEQQSIRGEPGDTSTETGGLTERLEKPDAFKGRNWTADALQYGAGLDPAKPEQLAELRRLEKEYSDKLNTIPKDVSNFDQISKVGNQKQWVTEAIQGATGLGGSDVARASLPKDYKPPFPQGERILRKALHESQADYDKRLDYFRKTGTVLPVTAEKIPDIAQPAAPAAPAPEPAKSVTEPVGPQTDHWPDVLKELVLDAPPTGALTEEKFKPDQPTRQSVIDNINRKLKLGAKPEDIIKAIQTARKPSGVISKLGLVDVDPVLWREEQERQRIANMTGPEKAAAEKKLADEKAFREANPPSAKELEIRAWENAWAERVPKTDQKTQLTKQDIANRELIERMNDKYGTPDPAKYRRQQSGEPPFKPPTGQASSGFREGDAVAMRDTDGNIYRGVVIQNGGDLWVQTPDDRVMRLRDGPWVASTKIPLEPADFTEYTKEKFQAQLEKEAKVRAGSKVKDELLTVLDKMEPGFMDRVQKAVQAVRADFTQRSLDPEIAGHNLIANVVEAAKAKHFADREFKGREQSHAKLLFERAKEHLLDLEKWAENVLKGRGTYLAPEVLAAYVVKGASVLARGAVDFAKWSDEMVREFGEKVRPYLKHVYDRSMAKFNEGNIAKNNPVTSWVQNDVAPFVGRAYDAGKAAVNFFVNAFSPATKARPGDVDALFEAKGYKEKMMTRAAAALEHANDAMAKLPREQQIDFVDRIKRGVKQVTPELQQIADMLRRWDDRLYAEATAFKPKLSYLDDHYRVLWKTIPGTKGLSGTRLEHIMSKRPWQGSRGFLLQHTLEDMSDGIHRGGVPVTYNPIEMFLLHAQDVMKYVSANRAFENLKKSGAAVLVEHGTSPPEGFTRIDDKIAKKYFRTDESGPGEWWVEKGAAQMINNYLSQDFIRQGAFGSIGGFLIGFKNLSTMVELGASPFHAVFETNEAVGSSIGRAVAKMATPGFFKEGASELARSLPGTIPVAGALIPKTAGPETVQLGARVERYAKNPEEFKKANPEAYADLLKKYPDIEHMVNDLFAGGGKVGMDEAYKSQWIKGFREAASNNNYIGAIVRALPMVNEQLLSPIFNLYIPRLKLGTFMKDYAFELSRRQGEIDSGKITREQLARETWAFVDDRFGELNWDNLYWNRTFKSAMQLLFRSVTWKLGNTRAFGKAGVDIVKSGIDMYKMLAGKDVTPRFTQPMGWLVGMALVTTIQSTIMSKVLTGKYPWELAENAVDLMKNLTFPRTDKDDASQRISNPTYWKDLVHLANSPRDYITSSFTGEMGRIADDWNNKDFYGDKVYNEDDPPFTKAKDMLEHLIPVPFSLSSTIAAKKSGAEGLRAYTGFMGYTKAPYYVSHSHAEQLAAKLLRDQLPVGGRTAEQAQKALKEHQAVLAIRRGEMTIDDAIDQGLIDDRQARLVEKQVEGNHVAYQLRTMNPEDSMKVWRVATPQEREVIHDEIEQKLYNNRTLDEDRKEQLLDELNK
jgi:hypothetical protein